MLLKAIEMLANGPDSVATYDAHEWDQRVEVAMGRLPMPSSSDGVPQFAQYAPNDDHRYDASQCQATHYTAGYYQDFNNCGGTWGV
jgi:hypothetical protein